MRSFFVYCRNANSDRGRTLNYKEFLTHKCVTVQVSVDIKSSKNRELIITKQKPGLNKTVEDFKNKLHQYFKGVFFN